MTTPEICRAPAKDGDAKPTANENAIAIESHIEAATSLGLLNFENG
ncbi:hypothetical protein [Candidatus Binatus sp.]